jgi:hypothetical protein
MAPKKKVVAKMVKPQAVTKVKKTPSKDFKDYLNVFEFDCVLPGTGQKVKFKPLTIGNIKQIASYSEEEPTAGTLTNMFDEIFRTSVISEDFDPLEIYLQDRYFLILEIRKKTKGEVVEYNMTCPECKSQSKQKIDFEDIPVKPKRDDINYDVPITGELTIRLRHLLRHEEKEIYDLWDTFKKNNQYENSTEADLDLAVLLEAQSIEDIITPDGVQDGITILDKKYLLENIPQPLYSKVADWYDKYNFGPEMTIKVQCPHCKFESQQDIANTDFFS